MKKKNILFICTDQHRKDSLSFYNNSTLCSTPNLDKLANHSIIFDRAYTTCPVCTPARCSMQTGLFPSTTGMETNCFQNGCSTHELVDSPIILSRRLQKANYSPLYTGKWHLGFGTKKEGDFDGDKLLKALKEENKWDVAAYEKYGTVPTEVGFIGDDFPGHGQGGWHFDQFKQYLKDNNLTLEIENTTGYKNIGDHSTVGEVKSPIESTIEYFLVERAINLIDDSTKEDKPFYLSLNFWGPHEPFFAPSEYLEKYKNVKIPKWDSFDENIKNHPRMLDIIRRGEQPWSFFENTLRHYYAVISHIDNQIGRLFDYLKEKNIYDDTVIIFTTDHGDYQGVHGGLENKSYGMYDDITNIPLLLKPAIKNYKSYHNDKLVSTNDFYATVLDIAGEKKDYNEGRSLLPFIDNFDINWSNEIMCEGLGAFDVIVTQRMYIKDNIKYIFNGVDKDQLFDLEKDENEVNNLIDKEPELLNSMKLAFSKYLKDNNFPLYAMFSKINHINEWDFTN
ncbi:MAG: sulfatase-like hydrolase/transferase [Pleomorphochaeta sp.]